MRNKHNLTAWIFLTILTLHFLQHKHTAWAIAESKKFKIGISIPLSGALAEYGVAIKNGITLAVSDQPEKFENIEFVYQDNEYQPKTSVTVFNRSLDLDKVNLTFIWGNEPVLAVVPIAERRKHPTIVVSQDPSTAIGYRYTIRFLNPFNDYAQALIGELRKEKNENIGIVSVELSFFNNMTKALESNLKSVEKITVIEKVLPSDYDFKTIIAKLGHQKFDAIGVFLLPAQVISFYRQLAESKVKLKTFGTTPFESKEVIKQSLGLMDGAVYSQINVSDQFQQKYLETYGEDIQIGYAANGYDFAVLVADLFGKLNSSLSTEEILKAFMVTKKHQGVTGAYQFKITSEGDRYFQFDMAVKKIKSGKIESEKFEISN
jgi:branched-chain amino acid transport system substrate-binding protein